MGATVWEGNGGVGGLRLHGALTAWAMWRGLGWWVRGADVCACVCVCVGGGLMCGGLMCVCVCVCVCGGGADVGGGGGGRCLYLHHNYRSPKQFLWIAYLETSELKGSKSTSCSLGATCLSRSWGRKVKWIRRKIGQAKNCIKKPNRTNVIATNFVWEQLKSILVRI